MSEPTKEQMTGRTVEDWMAPGETPAEGETEESINQARLLYLNSCPASTLKTLLKEVCHSDRWVESLSSERPYTSSRDLLAKGASAWSKCWEVDWLQALDGHPRIGDKAKGSSLSAKWSKGEQSKAQVADDSVTRQLKDVQSQYFEKFQFIFLICASGRGPEEILAVAQSRLQNSKNQELEIIAQEQAQIIHLRLEKLLK